MTYDPNLISFLEPSQLSTATACPLPRRAVGKGTMALLVLLRLYIVVALPVVGYAFVHAL
jgi:hypothetical protein